MRFGSVSARLNPARRHASDTAFSCSLPATTACPLASYHRSASSPTSARCCGDDRRSRFRLGLRRNKLLFRVADDFHRMHARVGNRRMRSGELLCQNRRGVLRDVAHDGLATIAHRHILYGDILLANRLVCFRASVSDANVRTKGRIPIYCSQGCKTTRLPRRTSRPPKSATPCAKRFETFW
jgi:hypothetical protein